MENVILAFPNRIDECTLTNGSWLMTLPLANLQDRIIRHVARSTDATTASTKFDAALTKNRPVKIIALINHNLSTIAKYRIRVSTVSGFATTVHDTGWVNVWQTLWAFGYVEWGEDNWWNGTLNNEDRLGYVSNLIVCLPNNLKGQYIRIELDDTANAAGHIDIGRVVIAPGWKPQTNYNFGLTMQYNDVTEVETSLAQVEYFNQKMKHRTTKFELEWLTPEEAYNSIFEMQRYLGISGEVFLIPDFADSRNLIRRAYLGRMKQLNAIEYPRDNFYKHGFEIKEVV